MDFSYDLEITLKKKEMLSTIQRYDSTVNLLITSVIAIMSFGVIYGIEALLLTNLAIYLIGQKILMWKDLMAKHAMYCEVFLENDESRYHWEGINDESTDRDKQGKGGADTARDREIIWLSVGNCAVFIFFFLKGIKLSDTPDWSILTAIGVAFMIMLAIVSCVAIVIYFYNQPSVHENRQRWRRIFLDIQASRACEPSKGKTAPASAPQVSRDARQEDA
jgi:hypothetical protein